jgi:hypothetical protein
MNWSRVQATVETFPSAWQVIELQKEEDFSRSQ